MVDGANPSFSAITATGTPVSHFRKLSERCSAVRIRLRGEFVIDGMGTSLAARSGFDESF